MKRQKNRSAGRKYLLTIALLTGMATWGFAQQKLRATNSLSSPPKGTLSQKPTAEQAAAAAPRQSVGNVTYVRVGSDPTLRLPKSITYQVMETDPEKIAEAKKQGIAPPTRTVTEDPRTAIIERPTRKKQ